MQTFFSIVLMMNIIKLIVYSEVKLNFKGEYSDVVIAIDEKVPYNENLIPIIKSKFTEASRVLEFATRRSNSGGVSFQNIHILLPDNWRIPSSELANWQTFDNADIRIYFSSGCIAASLPSTVQRGGCGQPGQYTRYTDYYFLHEDELNCLEGPFTAPPEKMIVHQWAHYRWGIFDEYPTTLYPEQVYSKERSTEPLRCSTSQIDVCQTSRFTNSADWISKVIPNSDDTSSRASLMFAPHIAGVNTFCDTNWTELSGVSHHSEAQNQQNEMCAGDSVWRVMQRHSDFKLNYPKRSNFTPKFKIIQKRKSYREIVMVLDVSSNMRGDNIETLKSAMKIFIDSIIESTAKLALVSFSNKAQILQNFVNVDSETMKQTSISIIDNLQAAGGYKANIPDGLTKAFQLLGGSMSKPEAYRGTNGYIVLITNSKDSGQNKRYSFDAIVRILQRSTVTIDIISIGSHTDDRLKILSEQTGGKYYVTDPKYTSTDMIENFISTLREQEKYSLVSKGKLSHNHPPELIATINKESGLDTVFVFKLEATSYGEVIVTSPSGKRYSKLDGLPIYSKLRGGKGDTITVKIPGDAEDGQWSAQIINNHRFQQNRFQRRSNSILDTNFLVFTKTRQVSNTSLNYVGNIDCGVIQQAESSTRCPCTMLITNHGVEILNAKVTLIMTSPEGEEVRFRMLDNGVGSDITAGDGVYTFSIIGEDLTESGIYNIRVEMQFVLTDNDDMNITRIAVLGGLKVNSPFSSFLPDTTPPDQIRKLTVDVVEMEKRQVNLRFISVGDDGDRGRASHYEFKVNDVLLNEEFNIEAKEARTEEVITLNLFKITQTMNRTHFTLSIRAVDNENNKGQWSMPYPLTFEKNAKLNDEEMTTPSSSNSKSSTMQGLIRCEDIIPPTWNYRCVVTVNLTGQPLVSMEIIDPYNNRKVVPMFNQVSGLEGGNKSGIYTASIIGRDFTVKGYYKITYNMIINKPGGVVNETIHLGRLFCNGYNPTDQKDVFPPDQIKIISAREIQSTDISILLTFLAVGDDGDRLPGKYYEFQVNGTEINTFQSNSTAPNEPGTLESLLITIDPFILNNSSIIAIIIRAVDYAGNCGNWSEPAIVRLKSRPLQEKRRNTNNNLLALVLFTGVSFIILSIIILSMMGIHCSNSS